MGSEIQTITGHGIPLVGNDVDTDRIIPARFLKSITFDGLGEQVFADDRSAAHGQHPFDLPQYQNAAVLVVNNNFGCGSSREHAPQAIARWGIQAIIGESFAEIFFGNCIMLGIPCVMAEAEVITVVQQHLQNNPQAQLTVNLKTMTVTWDECSASVHMADGPRQTLLSGTWDACGQLLAGVSSIRQTAASLPYLAW